MLFYTSDFFLLSKLTFTYYTNIIIVYPLFSRCCKSGSFLIRSISLSTICYTMSALNLSVIGFNYLLHIVRSVFIGKGQYLRYLFVGFGFGNEIIYFSSCSSILRISSSRSASRNLVRFIFRFLSSK